MNTSLLVTLFVSINVLEIQDIFVITCYECESKLKEYCGKKIRYFNKKVTKVNCPKPDQVCARLESVAENRLRRSCENSQVCKELIHLDFCNVCNTNLCNHSRSINHSMSLQILLIVSILKISLLKGLY
ncbi:hypothetical protein FQR65_LT03863 [Abscondita terminalis]|nr:hypothetical protein FQR65_LT03863 [Abscondita terminalis]